MYPIYNRTGEIIAYLHQNAIIHPDNFDVLGILLGNCVFGPQAKVLGKSFHDKVYSLKGELLARIEKTPAVLPQSLNVRKCIDESFQLMVRIKDHICPWIPERQDWASASLAEQLYGN